jgi:hypothetical protein
LTSVPSNGSVRHESLERDPADQKGADLSRNLVLALRR